MLNFYIPGTMHVDMSITNQQNAAASQYLIDGGIKIRDLSQKPIDKVFKQSLIASIQEHEFFHHRHSCSITYGYLTFIVSSIASSYRLEAVKHFPKPENISTLVDLSKPAINEFRDPFLYNMLRCQSIDLFLYFIENLDKKHAESLIAADEHINDYVRIHLLALSPTIKEKNIINKSPTVADLIEAIATWKQFNWLSLIWYGGQSPHARALEKEWLSWLSTNNPMYLNIANYIYSRCNVTLKNSMFGIIIDLALNPPVFSQGITDWTEFSPRLRLEAILDICKKLPKRFIKKDYLELITPDEYKYIVDRIEDQLAWRKSKDIISDVLKHIDKSINDLEKFYKSPNKGSKEYFEKLFHSRLTYAYLSQFQNGLINNAIYPGYMLFPWHNPNSEFVGNLLRPIATQYYDKLVLNIMRMEDDPNRTFIYDLLGIWIILQDMTENLWLFETINQNIKQTKKHYARKFYNGIPDALRVHFNYSKKVKKEVKTLLKKWKPFETFMSHRIGKDYNTYFVHYE